MRRKHITTLLPVLLLAALAAFLSCTGSGKVTIKNSVMPEEKLGWQLGVQAYTFKNFTFSETLQKIDSCGLRYVEAYLRQPIGNGIEGTMHFTMDAATRAKVKEMLEANKVKMISYGVVRAKGAEEWKQVFEFCKYFGIKIMTCEPEKNDLDIVSSLCDTYQVNAAIHNHAAPTAYWHPDSILNAMKGRSRYLGACVDVGHWVRSGIDPIAGLKKLKGRVQQFHIKDFSLAGKTEESEVTWGQGSCNIPGVMREMKSQGFKGMISVEYELNLSSNVGEIFKSVEYFRNQL